MFSLSPFVDVDVGLALHELCHLRSGLLAGEEGGGLLLDDVEDGLVVVGDLGGGQDELADLLHLVFGQGVDFLGLLGVLVPDGAAHDGDLLAVFVQEELAVLVLLVTTLFIVNEMYRSFTNSQLEVLHGQAKVIAYGINKDGLQFIDQLDDADYRITIIDEKGDVIYDNIDSDINAMDNHLDREEIIQAFSEGYGSSIRQSSTLMERYIYTAILLEDGNVVRLASTYPSVFHFLTLISQPLLVIILLIILISLYIAYKLANRIVKPLNEIDTDTPDQVP